MPDQTTQGQPAAEQILGYDARDYRDDYGVLWPQQRREQYLYRFDVKKVLSVDTRVWPTVFAALAQAPPPHQATLQDLWASAQSLRGAVSEIGQQQAPPAFRTVAVTLVYDGTKNAHPAREQIATLADPKAISPDWHLVGYDVADAFLLSALTNCGFLPGYDDAGRMRQEWGPYLNEFHLFRELKVASAFREMSDQRLAADHAPTFVYGIRIVK
jgi:hypothetical protein